MLKMCDCGVQWLTAVDWEDSGFAARTLHPWLDSHVLSGGSQKHPGGHLPGQITQRDPVLKLHDLRCLGAGSQEGGSLNFYCWDHIPCLDMSMPSGGS